jgi:hypothetical protein
VYTGVGATGSVECYRLTFNDTECFCQLTLNRPQVILYLPTMKVGAIVLNQEFEVHMMTSLLAAFDLSFNSSGFRV